MTLMDWLGLAMLFSLTFSSFVIAIGWVVLTVFFPKELENAVMRPPYFSSQHALMLRHFPQNLMRTTYLIGSITFDFYGKRHNGLQVARIHAPSWYRKAAYFVMYAGVINAAVSMSIAISWAYWQS